MKQCVFCDSIEIEEGEAVLKKGASDWMLFGLGWSSLFFREKGERAWDLQWESGHIRECFRCRQCRALFLKPGASFL